MPPKTERFELRLEPSTIERIDHWASRQPDRPNRSDALRRLVDRALETKIDDGDRLVIMMLRDIQKTLKIKDPEVDPDFLADVILGGHYWALDWKYTGLFHDHVDSRQVLHEVVDVLDMWSFLEEGYEALSTSEIARIEKEADPFGKYVKFTGFDGNNESEHMGIALFLVEKMDRFTRFKERDMNSHHPSIEAYARMFAVFEPIRNTLVGRRLSVTEIISILKARSYR
jgi:uncharacterized protein YfbU (UPF0304 family)